MALVKLISVVLALYAIVVVATSGNHKRRTVVYSNHFAVHVSDGKEAVDALADKHGFVNHGQVR